MGEGSEAPSAVAAGSALPEEYSSPYFIKNIYDIYCIVI
jgi:hypothetical protein